jgi:tetratricopeptide (TPR) repeat protein
MEEKMTSTSKLARTVLSLVALALIWGAAAAHGQIKGQFAQDFVAGNVPGPEEIARLEQEVAAHPDDFRAVRKLGKGYFFQVFGEGRMSSAPKSQKFLERALELKKDDGESLAYLGSLVALVARRSKDEAQREAEMRRSFEMLKKAQQLEPNNIPVLAVTGASYLFLPDSFGAAPLAAEAMENILVRMGPMFTRFSHHGQQRVLLTLGQAYAKMGKTDKARAHLEEALKVDRESVEATLIKTELGKLGQKP